METSFSGLSLQNSNISSALKDPIVREKILGSLSQQNVSAQCPALILEVTTSIEKKIKMYEPDVREVFANFGELHSIKMLNNTAEITFSDVCSAYFAQKILDGRLLYGDVKLSVSWSLPRSPEDAALKYNCKFYIHLESNEFPFARRLIGPKGANVKRIIESCCEGQKGKIHDILKLRLRGRHSGFREGPLNQESAESLHFCVSSKYEYIYKLAAEQVECLIEEVLEEFKNCGARPPQVTRHENTTGTVQAAAVKRIQVLEQLGKLSVVEINEFIDLRNEARKQCNFGQADLIRGLLKKKGVVLTDEKGARGRGLEVTAWKFALST